MEDNNSANNQKSSNPMKFIVPAILLLVIGAGAYLMFQSQQGGVSTSETVSQTQTQTAPTTDPNVPAAMTADKPIVIDVKGNNFDFDVKEIKVKRGQTVTINFTNSEGMHDWVIDEFNARTKVLEAGGKESITFVADKAGTFEYYCSVGQHRQMGMVGNLIVE